VNGRWVRAEGLTKGIDDAYRATVASGRYPSVALLVEVDPHQVDVNVHPTKQLVGFSDEKEVRLAISEALRNAIGGTGDPTPDQEGGSADSEIPGASLPMATESGAEAPLAEPERRPTEKHPKNETPAPVPTARRLAGNMDGDSISSEPPRPPGPIHQGHPTSRSSASA
jgi:DNA mismatch repair protein MutL